jgi:choline-sulfatase
MPDAIPHGVDGKPGWVRRRAAARDLENTALVRRQYCALIELIDAQIGRMLDALERRGMLDNTIIVFASDHGEMLGDFGLYQKSMAYEPALRVPLIAAGPGIAGGVVSDALVELFDVNPTLCELAGLPPQENIDARSFAPVLRGERHDHRSDQVTSMHNFRAIRTATHKFIENYNEVDELYDLENDPLEQHNIAAEAPEQAQELRRRLRQRMNEGKWLR